MFTEMRAMHAPEYVRVKSSLKLVERPVIRRTADLPVHHSNRLVGQGGVDDLFRLDQEESVTGSDSNLLTSYLATSHRFDKAFELFVNRFPRRRSVADQWP
jgi:hypothetical protein